jgi:hypothetical protein
MTKFMSAWGRFYTSKQCGCRGLKLRPAIFLNKNRKMNGRPKQLIQKLQAEIQKHEDRSAAGLIDASPSLPGQEKLSQPLVHFVE